jgi:hypothetical protein
MRDAALACPEQNPGHVLRPGDPDITPEREAELKASITECEAERAVRDLRMSTPSPPSTGPPE